MENSEKVQIVPIKLENVIYLLAFCTFGSFCTAKINFFYPTHSSYI